VQENYILRIYRRDKDKPHEVTGIIEHIESAKQLTFHNPSDLMEFLRLSRRQVQVEDANE
jgi:predicted nucleic acid-binding protein